MLLLRETQGLPNSKVPPDLIQHHLGTELLELILIFNFCILRLRAFLTETQGIKPIKSHC